MRKENIWLLALGYRARIFELRYSALNVQPKDSWGGVSTMHIYSLAHGPDMGGTKSILHACVSVQHDTLLQKP